MLHKCKYCDYGSAYRPNVRRHENNKHGVQEPTSHHQSTCTIKNMRMQDHVLLFYYHCTLLLFVLNINLHFPLALMGALTPCLHIF